jgi:hypothetical protein
MPTPIDRQELQRLLAAEQALVEVLPAAWRSTATIARWTNRAVGSQTASSGY